MLYLIVGENSYRIRHEIARLSRDFEGEISRVDGNNLTAAELADLIGGMTLFGEKKLVIIRDLSENSVLWSEFSTWLPRISDTTIVILVEATIDKRTKTYKMLKTAATVVEADSWTERDYREAEEWVDGQAHKAGIILTGQQAADMVRRATHALESGKLAIDQAELAQAVQALEGNKKITADMIDAIMPADINENVYELLSTALEGKHGDLRLILAHLQESDDPYRLFGLVVSQWFQLVALSVTPRSSGEVAAELGVHPFVMQKLSRYRTAFSHGKWSELTNQLANLDYQTKSTGVDPWYALERFLITVASYQNHPSS